MKRTLNDTESRLIAYVIQEDEFTEIPHSAFHSLETTHMKTILSQLHDNTWYKTFVRLNSDEQMFLREITHPVIKDMVIERELVVLKVLHEEKFAAELKLLNWIPRVQLYPNGADDRRILAIVREKLVDGRPLMRSKSPCPPLPPPPPHMAGIQPISMPRDMALRQGLTSYAEYTIRFRDHHANGFRALAPIVERVHNDQYAIRRRIQSFERHGGNVVSITLLLTERQSDHVNMLMKEIICFEPDRRFEWHWAELTLHNVQGEITDFYPRGGGSIAETANLIHVIARRAVKSCVSPETMQNLLSCDPPRGYLGAPLPPPGPPGAFHPPPPCPPFPPPQRAPGPMFMKIVPPRARPASSDDESSIASSTSILTRDLDFRGKLRRARRRRIARELRAKRGRNDSDSDTSSDLDEDEDDKIMIDLQLKKGDDIVAKLLELWTPGVCNKEAV